MSLQGLPAYARKSLGFFIVLNLADFCTTACIITLGGVEMMPIAKGFIDGYGIMGLFAHKLLVAAGVGYLCRNFTKRWWNLLNGLFACVVTWNTIQLCLFVVNLARTSP